MSLRETLGGAVLAHLSVEYAAADADGRIVGVGWTPNMLTAITDEVNWRLDGHPGVHRVRRYVTAAEPVPRGEQ